MKRIHTAAILRDGAVDTGGFLITIDRGCITGIEPARADGSFSGCIAVPGLVQMHIHLCQTLFRGMAENLCLLPWLQQRIWPLEASHSEDTLATSVIISLRELFRSGCTGLLDMGSVEHSSVTIDILRRSGIRAVAGNALMDRGPGYICRDLDWLREETERVRNCCGDLVSHALTPRFALSCSDRLWGWVAEEPGIRTTHAAESPDELDVPDIAGDGGNIHFLHNRGFLGPDTFLAHCIHTHPGEPELLRQTSTSVVHCPWANLKLGSGTADVPGFVSHGIAVFTGSDGAACNNRLDLAGDIRLAMGLASLKAPPGKLNGRFWFELATSRASEALGWKSCGTLANGAGADLVLLELDEREWDELDLAVDPIRYLLERDWPSNVRLTMVNGRVVYRDGNFPTLPPPPLSASKARREVAERAVCLTEEYA